ncbi:MAG: hydrogenase maturation protease [Chloroflexota bacterium]|nr:hydrogenase maturation protease [Chloroflexota bacterium]
MNRVLVAGMGNVLRRDDGFGVEVARRLMDGAALPAGVKVVEVGIGGVHLVQELMDGYDALVVIDAVERGSPPGTVHLLEAEVADVALWSERERGDFLADMHYTTPTKALILAKALGVLPPRVFILGCQPTDAGAMGIGLSEPVARAATEALGEIERLVRRLGRQPARASAAARPSPAEGG